MKQVVAYKSKSGDLYSTEEEAKVKDVLDEITEFLWPKKADRAYLDYSGLTVHRQIVIEELSRAIVKDTPKFKAIFEKLS